MMEDLTIKTTYYLIDYKTEILYFKIRKIKRNTENISIIINSIIYKLLTNL